MPARPPHLLRTLQFYALALAAAVLAAREPTTHGRTAVAFVTAADSAVSRQVAGLVFRDGNLDGRRDPGEPGMGGAWIAAMADSGRTLVSQALSDARGGFTLVLPGSSMGVRLRVVCIPPPGCYPVGPQSVTEIAASGDGPARLEFGVHPFLSLRLAAGEVLALGSGGLQNADRCRDVARERSIDLVAGGEVGATDQLSVWFERPGLNPVYATRRDYARTAPNSVLALAVDTLSADDGPCGARADVVTGTRRSAAGNFFTWFTQGSRGDEGYVPASYTQACLTADQGDVQALATGPIAGGPGVDIAVGTRSPGGDRGTVELWLSDDARTPRFRFAARYPPDSAAASLGEVTAMALVRAVPTASWVVGANSAFGGRLVALEASPAGDTLHAAWSHDAPDEAVRCLAIADITGDGVPDLIVGLQTDAHHGVIELWRGDGSGATAFTRVQRIGLDGWPSTLATGDFGGTRAPDLAVGLRNRSDHTGRLEIFYCDAGALPVAGSDPSGGGIGGWIPAVSAGDPEPAKPGDLSPRISLAAAVRNGSGRGSIVVFAR